MGCNQSPGKPNSTSWTSCTAILFSCFSNKQANPKTFSLQKLEEEEVPTLGSTGSRNSI